MNLKISVDRPQHRAPRKPVIREAKPMEYAPISSSTGSSSLANFGGTRKIEALRRQQVVRRMPRPRMITEAVEAPQPSLLSRAFSWLKVRGAAPKQLSVLETVSLGEKRFAAILQADGRRYLIGGGTTNVTLLAQLDETTESIDDLETLAEMTESSE
jgi:hypothetical protein